MTVPPDWLAAVAANPDDDLVRLAFADWLDEQGDAGWAELIRVQCALEPVRGAYLSPELPRVVALERREAELLKANAAAVLARFGYARDHATHRIDFARGMPERLRITMRGFETAGAEICQALPTLRRLTLTELQYGISGLADSPHLAGFERLDLCDYLEPWLYVGLGQTPPFAKLRALSYWFVARAAPSPGRAVWDGGSLRELTLIDLHGDPAEMAPDGRHNREIDAAAAPMIERGAAQGVVVAVERPCVRPGYVGGGWPWAFGRERPAVTRPFIQRTQRGTLSATWLPRDCWDFVDRFAPYTKNRVAKVEAVARHLAVGELHFGTG